MSVRRFREIYWLDLLHFLRRPLFWIWVFIVVLFALLLAKGGATIESGDADVGGTKAWLTSEFAMAKMLGVFVPICYVFFIAVASGMPIIRDDELEVGELIHSTPVRAGEYLLAKFLAPLTAALFVLALNLGAFMLFNHVFVTAKTQEVVGPFVLGNYLRPALLFCVPTILFYAGSTFAIGTITRRPITVFVFPVMMFLLCVFVLWQIEASWIGPTGDRILMLCDPTGFRWFSETWLQTDRGVEFFNTGTIELGPLILANRLGFAALGILGVFWSYRHFAAHLRGTAGRPPGTATIARTEVSRQGSPGGLGRPARLGDLCMLSRPTGFLRSFWNVLRVELRELVHQPGIALFIPLIVVDSISEGFLMSGPFETTVMATPGLLAMSTLPGLTVLLALLLMFYTIESLRREKATQLAPIFYSAPMGSAAVYFGKIAANAVIGLVAVSVTLVACTGIIAYKGAVPLDALPFALVWGLLLLPTLILWCSFVAFVYTLFRNAWATYGLSLFLLILTGFKLATGSLTWRWNWPLWNTMGWSDADVFPLDREALLLNRAMVLSAALLFVILAVRIFPRREFDPQRILLRLRPAPLLRTLLFLSPVAILPVGLNIWLGHRVDAGYEGEYREKETKDYWRKNVATWRDAPVPDIKAADVRLELDPSRRWFRTEGEFVLVNLNEDPLDRFPITSGPHWEDLAWTMNGEPYAPADRTFLHIFTPPTPLAPGDEVRVGFAHHGIVNEGISRNGGGADQFILPAGVVLHTFGPSFVPTIGFIEGVGVDKDNAYDAREYSPDHYAGDTPSAFGGWSPYPVRLEVSAPAAYTINGIGVETKNEVVDGVRTVVWETDHPVQFFNVVAGKWDVRRGEGTAVFYFPEHPYNIGEMIEALDGARKHYSEWFYRFPWQELKLSEFANLAGYAQGFATNITFSEGIGFLTESDADSNAAFLVAAHESAHQWWGNILSPGRGPGGNLLSEGTSHFSTILLFDAVKGEEERMAFCRQIERRYGRARVVDSERPLVWIDGSRPGDTTVTYDKAGWVFWMLLQRMGREPCLEGIRSFIAHYVEARDHPVLQDFTAHLRDFAPDVEAYDDFVQQWFLEVVMPEYKLEGVEVTEVEPGARWKVTGTLKNVGTGRMPVTLAAERGERFPDPKAAGGAAAEEPAELFTDTRIVLEPGAKDEVAFTIECSFEPERVVVDPDVLVLQLNRKFAIDADL